MVISPGARSALAHGVILSVVSSWPGAPGFAQARQPVAIDVVAVAVLGEGRSIVLATRGLPHRGKLWRFRSLDTGDLPQPIRDVQLASTGTKLFLQSADGDAMVLDLTRQHQHNMPLQYVSPLDVALNGDPRGQAHRLPRERFTSVRDGMARVVDDTGEIRPEYPIQSAPRSAITGNGSMVDALRALLIEHDLSIDEAAVASLVDGLVRESTATWASGGEPITNWRFFAVAPDEELYAPVVQFARTETVFPGTFAALEELARGAPAQGPQPVVDRLYQRYLRRDPETRRQSCTIYFRTHSAPGSWTIEYWLYYPFDTGGLGAHPHDPEHMFVEVDKLGGAPRRVIGAGHGYMAGNNVYRADRRGAHALTLPLFAIAELGKHGMAPDVNRDGVFTPGVDENEYRERAKVWGVRDVIGRINNQLLAFDVTMSVRRRPEDALALASTADHFPGQPDLAAHPTCRLEPIPGWPELSTIRQAFFRLSDWVIVPPCHEPTTACAQLHVTGHPDFLDQRTILKEWSFPQSFIRAGYGAGPRRGLHTFSLGYAMDLDRVPVVGRILPLPGRLGGEVFHWRQAVAGADRDSCLAGCEESQGVGWGLRYEQFLSNLFGIFSSTRVYSPPAGDLWITFGPFVEVPLGRRSNVNLQGGLSFRPTASPRFELRMALGLWKPKTNHIGMRAGKDDGSH